MYQKSRDQDAALGGARPFRPTDLSPPPNTRFTGASPYSFGSGKPWPVGFAFIFFARGARIDQILRHALIDQQDLLARNAFAIEWRARVAAGW